MVLMHLSSWPSLWALCDFLRFYHGDTALTDCFVKSPWLGRWQPPLCRPTLGQIATQHHTSLRPGHVRVEILRCQRTAYPHLRSQDGSGQARQQPAAGGVL